jgi:RHS repeat-associated protein
MDFCRPLRDADKNTGGKVLLDYMYLSPFSCPLVDDATGGLRLHRTYDSFGNIIDETHYGADEYGYSYTVGESDPEYVDLAFAYTGRLLDKATGLQNNLNRWYDASIGRWLSEDPIGFNAGDANLYRYVGNGPVNARDPSGLWRWWDDYLYYLLNPSEMDSDLQVAQTGALVVAGGAAIGAGGVLAYGAIAGAGTGSITVGSLYGQTHVTFGAGSEVFHALGVRGAMAVYGFTVGESAMMATAFTMTFPLRNPNAVNAAANAGTTFYNCATAAFKCLVAGI